MEQPQSANVAKLLALQILNAEVARALPSSGIEEINPSKPSVYDFASATGLLLSWLMRTLFHMPLDPASRMVRLVLSEKGLVARYVEKYPWADDGSLAAVNPACAIPVLIDEPPSGGELAVSPAINIVEYLDEAYPAISVYPNTSAARAETRRLCAWFDDKLNREVNDFTLRERVDKRLMKHGQPDYDLLKQGVEALGWHLDYIGWLLDQRSWLAGEKFSIADIAGAAHLSALDYIDAVPWEKFPAVMEWYARMKSRPSMRPILKDRIAGLPPPSHYENPDF